MIRHPQNPIERDLRVHAQVLHFQTNKNEVSASNFTYIHF